MLDFLLTRLNLQLFAEGADGGDASVSGEGAGLAEEGGDNIPSSIPPRARKFYQKAVEKNNAKGSTTKAEQVEAQPEGNESPKAHIAYADLIKSDEYKEEHQAYMDKTIGDRLKKYKGIEEKYNKANEVLNIVANKYSLDPSSETFLDDLRGKAEEDDSYFENYAMEHDITPEEARKIVTLERKVASYDAEREAAEREEASRQQVQIVLQNAEATKREFPDFDLETEMQDERFRQLVLATNGDTTAAYQAIHYKDLVRTQVTLAQKQSQQQTANAVKANMSRPIEGGLSSQAAAIVQSDFRGMNLTDIRKQAEVWRRQTH